MADKQLKNILHLFVKMEYGRDRGASFWHNEMGQESFIVMETLVYWAEVRLVYSSSITTATVTS